MTQRDMAVTAVCIRVWDGDKFPMLHRPRTNFRDVPEWAPPMGHVEAGETPPQAAVRELLQELGIEVEENDLRLVHVLYRPKHDPTGARVDYFYDLERYKGNVINAEPDQHDDLRWFTLGKLPKDLMPHVRHVYECVARGRFSSELGIGWLQGHGYVTEPVPAAQEGGS